MIWICPECDYKFDFKDIPDKFVRIFKLLHYRWHTEQDGWSGSIPTERDITVGKSV